MKLEQLRNWQERMEEACRLLDGDCDEDFMQGLELTKAVAQEIYVAQLTPPFPDKDLKVEVKEMRRLQKSYYRTRDHDLLLASKEQEKVIDEMISDQPSLF